MASVDVGGRVGAILKGNIDEVHLFGYGVYDGDHIPEEGWMHEAGIPNPRITLDDGRKVYGYQCWWGAEEKIKETIGSRKVIIAAI